jgi:two-component system CheB/CheR fusion protein
MVFVVVTHLHPEHESHMAELLQRHTQMPTMQVNEKVQTMDGQGGLLNVRQRLSLMGCQMKLDSGPGKGTRVIVDVPSQEVK